MKKLKKTYHKLKTDEHPRHKLRPFKVRCSLETAFYVVVEAHNAEEAEIVAENWCRKSDEKREDGLFWSSEASHMHPKFEAEED